MTEDQNLSIINAVCKDYQLQPEQTYSRCEHLKSDHEINKCGDIWCNMCLAICIFCVDCSNEISNILNQDKKGGDNTNKLERSLMEELLEAYDQLLILEKDDTTRKAYFERTRSLEATLNE